MSVHSYPRPSNRPPRRVLPAPGNCARHPIARARRPPDTTANNLGDESLGLALKESFPLPAPSCARS